MLLYYFSATGLVTSTDILSILKAFCGDHTKPADIRREVLQLTEKVNMLYTSIQLCVFTVYYMYTVLGATGRGAPSSITVSDSISVAGAVWNTGTLSLLMICSECEIKHISRCWLVVQSTLTFILLHSISLQEIKWPCLDPCKLRVNTVVSRKGAYGRCTLPWVQIGEGEGVGRHSSCQHCVLLSTHSGANIMG